MAKFNANNLISILNDNAISKSQKAKNINTINAEMSNLFDDIKAIIDNQSVEDTIKYLLWQGLLNNYGIFGYKRNEIRTFGKYKKSYSDKSYNRGDLLSIDFGTSNIGKEFSYTHTGIVIGDYSNYVIIIPITTCEEGRLDNKSSDELQSTMIIYKKDCPILVSDSFVLLYQIKSVSKNRITKNIGNISNTPIMNEIDTNLAHIYIPNLIEE